MLTKHFPLSIPREHRSLIQASYPIHCRSRYAGKRCAAKRHHSTKSLRSSWSHSTRLLTSRTRKVSVQRKLTCTANLDDDDEELYYGEYSNFWSDPEQIRGVLVFCTVLGGFFSVGLISSGLLLPSLFGNASLETQVASFDYWFKF
ncbi:hypothetical protein CYMTET_11961 [Cymbomonas tetramitiformis]|uniref:Uncharacterized protein n=1 Tax=Cymbomonas tetramitiformis TaxID=36881 RepID=A0AAE0GMQ2_9CHLO|nr:hypothetical protein CYMTET_11961 [Cymbomonas tetramitiformis]